MSMIDFPEIPMKMVQSLYFREKSLDVGIVMLRTEVNSHIDK